MKNQNEVQVQTFENLQFGTLRTIEIDGEPWFVGKDVATILGYAKPENAIANHVDEEDKTTTLIRGIGSNYKSRAVVINESGLYSLLFAMQPQKANHDGVSDAYPIEVQERIEKLHLFKRWVTSEVLPSIRKTMEG